MNFPESRASHRLVVLAFALIFPATPALAILQDCALRAGAPVGSVYECTTDKPGHPPTEAAIPSSLATKPAAPRDFQVNPSQASAAPAHSAPLVVLLASLVTVLLIRAKSCNSK